MENATKLYHVSKTPNLKEIEPRVSKHGIPYVYATTNVVFALLFGSSNSHGDLDGKMGIKHSIVQFIEAFPNSFKERFCHQTCYIYEVDPTTFEAGKTDFRNEVVSSVPVKVLGCQKIDDLYLHFQSLINKNEFCLIEFKNTQKYQAMIDEHIKKTIQRFDILRSTNSDGYKFCKQHFPHLVNELNNNKTN